MYAVLEDTPQRLVLATRGSRYTGALILGILGGVFAWGYTLEDSGPVRIFCGIAAVLLGAATAYSLLRWRRFEFDKGLRRVRFSSQLFGRFEYSLDAIERLETTHRAVKSRDQEGLDSSYYVTHLYMVVEGRRVELNQAADADFINELKDTIESLKKGRLTTSA
jgi:hypothetical protein